MPAELAHYTITGAQDWPMFKEMLAGMRVLFLLLWGTIGALVGFMWRDLRNRIASPRVKRIKRAAQRASRRGIAHSLKYGTLWTPWRLVIR